MTATVTLTLPTPPSTNKLWRHSGKRVYLNARYVAWKRTAGWELAAQRPDRFSSGTEVAVVIRVGRSRKDTDNLAKATLDLLQNHRIISNDKLVADLRIVRDANIEPGRVLVEIKAIPSQRSAA